MQQLSIATSEDVRVQSVALLLKHLATAIELRAQLEHAHRTIRGDGFVLMRDLFEQVSGEVANSSYLIAERVGGLGGVNGAIRPLPDRFFSIPHTAGADDDYPDIVAVSENLLAFGQSIRAASRQSTALGDCTTADLFIEVSRCIDRQLCWVELNIESESST